MPASDPTVQQARDVLATRIEGWAGMHRVYDYADRLITDLYAAGFVIVPRAEYEAWFNG